MSDPTIAGPRRPYSSATYRGDELATTPARPGATDAARIPSLFNGQRVTPAALKQFITAQPEAYVPPAPMARTESAARYIALSGKVDAVPATGQRFHALPVPPKKFRTGSPRPERALTKLRELKPSNRTSKGYTPEADSTVGKTLAYLREHGGPLHFAQVDERFGSLKSNRTTLFRPALEAGLMIRTVVDRKPAYALPGFVAPLPPPVSEKRPKGLTDNQRARLEAGIKRWTAAMDKLRQECDRVALKLLELQADLAKHTTPE